MHACYSYGISVNFDYIILCCWYIHYKQHTNLWQILCNEEPKKGMTCNQLLNDFLSSCFLVHIILHDYECAYAGKLL